MWFRIKFLQKCDAFAMPLPFPVPTSSSCSCTSSEGAARQCDVHQFPPHLVPSTGGDYQWSHHCLHPGVWWEQWWNSSMQHLPLWRGWGTHGDCTETSHWVLREGGSCECCWKGPLLWTSASADSTRQWVLCGACNIYHHNLSHIVLCGQSWLVWYHI